MNDLTNLLNSFDVNELREKVSISEPFPYFFVDNFLDEDFANEVHDAFPAYDDAIKTGRSFNAVNEAKKVQITDSTLFPPPIAKLHKLLSSKEFIRKIEGIFNLSDLHADPQLRGGGIHETREGGRLDVHVDFNFNTDLGLYRRANILIYFNKNWKKEYGGILDLWDKDVKKCYAEIVPVFNRMVCFATSEISYHGVTPLRCPDDMVRKSFAAYYYTSDASKDFNGAHHSTIFKARPDEWMQAFVKMPAAKTKRQAKSIFRNVKDTIKKLIKS